MSIEQKELSLGKKLAKLGSEDYPDSSIPKKERLNWIYITIVWFGAVMFVGLYYCGVELGTSMGNLSNVFIAVLAGALFLSTFVCLNGIIGQKTGCNAALAATYAYGSKGVAIPGFHITDIAWYVVMTAQFVHILSGIFPQIDVRVYAIVFSMLFITNGYVGFKQMARLNMIAMPLLLIVGLFGLYRINVIIPGGMKAIWFKQFPNNIPIFAAITIVIGTWVSGSSRAADYFRWAKTKRDVVIPSYLGFFVGYIICIGVGVFWGAGTGETDIAKVLGTLGMVGLGMLMFFFQTWTTNEHSGYVSSCALPVAYRAITNKNLSRRKIIAGIAIFSMAFAGLGIENYYIPFISFLGIFVPIIAAVTLSDFYIMSRTKYHWTGHRNFYDLDINDEEVQHHKFNWAIVPALPLGFLCGYKLNWGIGAINSLVGTALVYCIGCVILYFLGLQSKEKAKNKIK